VGNESQERMGLVMKKVDMDLLRKISERERAPFYIVGEITDDKQFVFKGPDGINPIDIKLEHLFGTPPRTVLTDETKAVHYKPLRYEPKKFNEYIESILQLEAVACKDWLTNKVDRCVTGKVAMQQTAGTLQIPINDVGVVALDYVNHAGIATSIGHAPVAALIDPEAGSVLSIAEALTNLVWAPIKDGLFGVSLSANWMWPAKNTGENARLYKAVEAASKFAIDLGINIPTGKDSLSMTQKYPNGDVVFAPGTVIISAAGEVTDITKAVSVALKHISETYLLLYRFFKMPTTSWR
jgi:phosphoribosylformylglycinamidine synthase